MNGFVRALFVIVAAVAVMAAFGCLFTVNERELAVVLEFGRPVRGISEPGLNFKLPLIQSVRRLPKTNQFWANTRDDMLVDLPTRDGKKIEVSAWAIWRITDPQTFVTVMQTENNAQKQIRQRVRAAIRDVITVHDLSEVVRSTDRPLPILFGQESADAAADVPGLAGSADGPNRTPASVQFGRVQLLNKIRERVQEELSSTSGSDSDALARGIEIVDVGVSTISFTNQVRQAAFQRLIAFMESVAARHTNEGLQKKQEILNQTKAEVERTLGEGEEQSRRIRGQVEAEIIEMYAEVIQETGDFYNFQKTLEVYEKALGKGTRLILTTDSDLFRMLKQIRPPEP